MDDETGRAFDPCLRPFLPADYHWLADTSYPTLGKLSVKEGMSKLISSCWSLSHGGGGKGAPEQKLKPGRFTVSRALKQKCVLVL